MRTNALIVRLAGPGVPDRNGDVTTPGQDVWRGSVPAYLVRKRSRQRIAPPKSAIGSSVVPTERTVFADTLVVPVPPGPLLQALPGDDADGWTLVLVDYRAGGVPVTRRFRLVMTDHRAIGSRVDSLRLELDDEQAV